MRILCALMVCVLAPVSARAEGTPAARVRAIFEQHCYRCHGQHGVAEGGFNYVLDLGKLVERRKIVARSPDKSRLLNRMRHADDPMPPLAERVRPSKADLEAVETWIAAGAVADAPAQPAR
ncbi:MAG: cytochrome c, partial [Gemmataceae bacterium]